MLLAGDIGGTSTRLALVRVERGRVVVVAQEKYSSQEHGSLDEIARIFGDQHAQPIERACFGIAGPVREGRVRTSNLPWVIDAAESSAALKIPHVHLINDLEANAHGIAALEPADLVTLHAGQPNRQGNVAILSAGTGLGEAGGYFDGRQLRPFATEGGHTDFAPQNDLEAELLVYLRKNVAADSAGHVSYERILSGPGLYNVYRFLVDTGRGKEKPEIAAAIRAGDPGAAISKAALAGSCDLCTKTMDVFVTVYGAEAGNLALKIFATGGVYIGGGIAPKIISKLREPQFLQAFFAKGRLRPVMEAMPVHVILNESAGLLGAARYAADQAGLVPPWTP